LVTDDDRADGDYSPAEFPFRLGFGLGSIQIALGFVKSPNHPGGNMTGLASLPPELEAKSLSLLAELVPGLNRVAVLLNPENLLTT